MVASSTHGQSIINIFEVPEQDSATYKAVKIYEGFRGFWVGFNRGIYKRGTKSLMEQTCLNESTRMKFTRASFIFEGKSHHGDWLTAVG